MCYEWHWMRNKQNVCEHVNDVVDMGTWMKITLNPTLNLQLFIIYK